MLDINNLQHGLAVSQARLCCRMRCASKRILLENPLSHKLHGNAFSP